MKLGVKHLAWIAAGAAVLVAVVLLVLPGAVPVDVVPASRGPLTVTVDEEGRTRVRERFIVSAPVTGRLERPSVDEGDVVDAGAVVARITPIPLDPRERRRDQARLEAAVAAWRAAEARLDRDAAALEQARRDHARADELALHGVQSSEQRERAELAEASLAKAVDASRAAVREAAFQIDECRAALVAATTPAADGVPAVRVLSPGRGRVLRLREESERVVEAGTPLVEIGYTGELEVVAELLSEDAVRVEPGDRMIVEDWGGATPLHGVVRTVEPGGFTKVSALGVEEQRVRVIAGLPDPPPELGDGYRVQTRTVVWEAQDVLKIPASAAIRAREGWSVFVFEGGRARRRPVTIDHQNPFEVEVTGGLEAGDRVVMHPSDELRDGVRVRVRRGD